MEKIIKNITGSKGGIVLSGYGMCKEQRKFLLMVALGSVIPIKLFQKFNLCNNCAFATTPTGWLAAPGDRKQCNKCKEITVIYGKAGRTGVAQYCYNWEKNNDV